MSRLMQLNVLMMALAVFAPRPVLAQGDAMIELYGEGVHRYFSHDYAGANELLTQVVEAGTVDPRVYYFRGLAQEMLGSDGTDDFQAGAQLEAEGRLVVQVGSALTRVQGALRSEIEAARRNARVAYRQDQLAREAARRRTIPQPAIEPDAAPAPPSDTTDLFGGDASLSSEEKMVDPVQPEVDATIDPFQDEPAPATTPPADSGTSPFDAPAGGEAGNIFDTPASPDDSDPFGNPAADPDNPFDPPATDADNPFDPPAAGGEDNPLGL